jgi:starch-binding outer membrane protein, SusD/RagB family
MIRKSTSWLAVGVMALCLGSASCGDLTLQPQSQITSANIFSDPASYQQFLAKLYAGLATTGQSGPAGNPDINGIDEGFSQYVRGYWQLQELPTDEAIIGWGDTGLPELNTQTWSAGNPFTTAMYARIFYQVALANEFLRQTTPEMLASRGTGADVVAQVAGYRAEARFLRALSYYHAADLFGPVPVVDENFNISGLPAQSTRADVVAFVESELKAVRPSLAPTSTGNFYGRASQQAVDMTLAHLYLNSKVWTGTDRAADALAAASSAIALGRTIDPNFARIFSADNQTSPEMMFSVPFDGTHTRTYGGTTYLIHASVGDNMDPAAAGIDGGWYGLRLRPEAVDRFATGDTRANMIQTSGRTKDIGSIGSSNNGYALLKYRNVTTGGAAGSNLTFPDTDFPLYRLADAYLIYAEAVLRGGGGSRATALGYINQLRTRAFGGPSGNITDAQMTLPFILDERGRELLWEGFRRQDLIRFGQFSSAGVWAWKGNVAAGKVTEAFHDLYPIPSNELAANPTLKQNPGY